MVSPEMKIPMRKLYFLLLLPVLWLQSCLSESDSFAPNESSTGVAGSYARFMIVGARLYVVGQDDIKTYSLDNPADPVLLDDQAIGSNIETIFNLGDKLFIGAGSGLYIYTINAVGVPEKAGEFLYSSFNFGFEPCDPVVANETYAYVTLNTTNRFERCRVTIDEQVNLLNIFNIEDIYNPWLVAQYPMHNPKGVGLDGDLLFLCDDSQGLKVFDVADPQNIQLLAHFTGYTAFDVIPLGGLLLVVSPDNVYQYDYSDPQNIVFLSQLPLGV
jgi:hypothetical protein